MITLNFLQQFVETHANIAYVLIVLGVIAEGEIVVIIAGIFANLGSLNIFYAFLATLLGGSLKSMIGYSVGMYLHTSHSNHFIVRNAEKRLNYFLPKFHQRQFWSLFVSRFLVLGLHWFSLIFSGYKKIKMRRFTEAELASLLVWSVTMLSIGYFFSYTALSISNDVRKFLGIILIFFIIFFIIERIVAFIIELVGLQAGNNNEK
jgi:membrane protein DedA with SNARE-associated domain